MTRPDEHDIHRAVMAIRAAQSAAIYAANAARDADEIASLARSNDDAAWAWFAARDADDCADAAADAAADGDRTRAEAEADEAGQIARALALALAELRAGRPIPTADDIAARMEAEDMAIVLPEL